MAKGLEIRINSVQDAKTAVQNMVAINGRMNLLGCTHIELCVANEIEQSVRPILSGVFRAKTLWRKVATQSDNVLYTLPPFMVFHTTPSPTQTSSNSPAPARKVGWPKGRPRKPKPEAQAQV